jgi:endonuclease/exonuclease/phosphatase family metal-dependent hydrolase
MHPLPPNSLNAPPDNASPTDTVASGNVPSGQVPPVPAFATPSNTRRRNLVGFLPWGLLVLGVLGLGSDRVASPPATGVSLGSPAPNEAGPIAVAPEATPDNLRLVLWNIHSGVGLDGAANLDRIGTGFRSILASPDAQIVNSLVGMNEVRAGWTTDDLARQLGDRLGLPSLFAPAERQWGRDHFGNGVLGSAAVTRWQTIPLPNTKGKGYRNIVLLRTNLTTGPLTVLHTHIDRNTDRIEQLGVVFDLFRTIAPPVVLMGDLNTSRDDPQLSALLQQPGIVDLVEPWLDAPRAERIDWIIGRGVRASAGGLVESGASDHPLLWVDVSADAIGKSEIAPQR